MTEIHCYLCDKIVDEKSCWAIQIIFYMDNDIVDKFGVGVGRWDSYTKLGKICPACVKKELEK